MGSAGSAIVWNSAPDAVLDQILRQPSWSYYSLVAMDSRHARVDGWAECDDSRGRRQHQRVRTRMVLGVTAAMGPVRSR